MNKEDSASRPKKSSPSPPGISPGPKQAKNLAWFGSPGGSRKVAKDVESSKGGPPLGLKMQAKSVPQAPVRNSLPRFSATQAAAKAFRKKPTKDFNEN